MPSIKQTSFAGGLLSEQFLGRTDLQKYATGLRTCANFWITRFGTAENRPGTQYIGTAHFPTFTNRLIKFVFNTNVSYLLEFGGALIIPYKNGARISTVGAPAYSGITAYVVGNVVTYLGATYVCQLASTGNLPTNTTYWILLVGNLLVIPSGFQQSWLANFQTVQQNDVMTFAQQSMYPQQLRRTSDTQWTTGPFVPFSGVDAPTGLAVTAGRPSSSASGNPTGLAAVGGNAALPKDYYVVSAGTFLGNQSAASTAAGSTVGGADGANNVVLTWTAASGSGASAPIIYYVYKLFSGVYKLIGTVRGNPPAVTFTDTGLAALTPEVVAPTAPANVFVFTYQVTAVSAATNAESLVSATASCTGFTPTGSAPNLLTWTGVSDADEYRVYRAFNGAYGFIGNAGGSGVISFSDDGIIPNTAIQPPTQLTLFSVPDDYPGVVGVYQQRLGFASSINNPEQINWSRIGIYTNFNVSTPISDLDAIQISIASVRDEAVQHLVDLGKLVIHTNGAEYVANGDQAGSITPLSVGLVRQGTNGAAYIPPVVLGNSDLFIQARGGYVRDLRYEIQSTSFAGKDTTVYAPDLFANRTIVSMDWQQIPHSIVWAALDDGTLLGLTYIRDQDIWAWHTHDLDGGFVEQVCVVPESTEDVVYLTVRRAINGTETRYIERLANRLFETIDDAVFVDSSLSYDGRNTGSRTMIATTAGGWTPQDNLTLTASTAYFSSGDVGNAIVFQQLDSDGNVTDQVTFDIIAYTSTTVVTVQSDKDVPTWARGALTTWGKAVHHFTGLSHLEGEEVIGLGDGDVLPAMTVASGAVTTQGNFLRATIGLAITADLQTLPIENTQGETIANKKVLITELTAVFYQTRGASYGQDFDHLYPWTQRQLEPWSDPVSLFTGPVRIPVQGAWQTTGGLCIRQTDPLPIGISALVCSAFVGN